jgi:hypothetical protein
MTMKKKKKDPLWNYVQHNRVSPLSEKYSVLEQFAISLNMILPCYFPDGKEYLAPVTPAYIHQISIELLFRSVILVRK